MRGMPAAAGPTEGRVRARTRALLLDAALRVFARDGVDAAIHQIANEAGVANGTFYNYFRSREELLEAAGVRLTERFHREVATSRAGVADPAERVAIGCRRFILQALADPTWGAAVLRVWGAAAVRQLRADDPLRADLRAGRRRRRFRYASETAALDLVQGAVLAGMRSILEQRASEEHAAAVAGLVLQGLGVDGNEADAIARRPLPPLPRR
jgi:AcrR family transcriptional regulator